MTVQCNDAQWVELISEGAFRVSPQGFFGAIFPLGAVHKLRLQEEGGRWSKKIPFL